MEFNDLTNHWRYDGIWITICLCEKKTISIDRCKWFSYFSERRTRHDFFPLNNKFFSKHDRWQSETFQYKNILKWSEKHEKLGRLFFKTKEFVDGLIKQILHCSFFQSFYYFKCLSRNKTNKELGPTFNCFIFISSWVKSPLTIKYWFQTSYW